jgi:hypothetical protein
MQINNHQLDVVRCLLQLLSLTRSEISSSGGNAAALLLRTNGICSLQWNSS